MYLEKFSRDLEDLLYFKEEMNQSKISVEHHLGSTTND